MNEQTKQTLTELSNKLGTTEDHLWEVLVNQAPITGFVSLLLMTVVVSALVFFFRFIRRKEIEFKSQGLCWYDWDEETFRVVWGIWFIVTVPTVLVIFLILGDAVSAILNPEYWALTKIIACK